MATPPPNKTITSEDVPGAPGWLDRLLDPLNAHMRSVASALERGLTQRENAAGEERVVTITVPEDWVTPTLASGWAAVGGTAPRPLQYRKTWDGKVEVRGRVDYPTGTPATSATIFTLPTGYAPDLREIFDCRAADGALAYSPATLSAYDGAVRWEAGGHRNLSASGDVWWMASDRTPPRWETPVDVRLGSAQRPFPGKPGSVDVRSVVLPGNPSAAAFASGIDWTPIAPERGQRVNGIRIHRVWGLTPGLTYSLTLFISPE